MASTRHSGVINHATTREKYWCDKENSWCNKEQMLVVLNLFQHPLWRPWNKFRKTIIQEKTFCSNF